MSESFTLKTNNVAWDKTLLQASAYSLQPGVETHLMTSDEINNASGTIYNSLKLTLEYEDLDPNFGQFFIGAVVEEKDNQDHWVPIGYQYSPLRSSSQANTRIIIIQPDMDTFNLGIDDIVFPVDEEVARISRIQGALSQSQLRVKLCIKDNLANQAGAWVSVKISGSGELYNV